MNLFKGTNSLIMLDDCASGQEIRNRTSEAVKLGFSARPTIEKTSKLVAFYTTNRNDMKNITDDYLSGVDKAEINRITKLDWRSASGTHTVTLYQSHYRNKTCVIIVMPKRKTKTTERNDNPMEDLVNNLKVAEEEVKTAAEEAKTTAEEPKDEPRDNVDKQRVGALVRRL